MSQITFDQIKNALAGATDEDLKSLGLSRGKGAGPTAGVYFFDMDEVQAREAAGENANTVNLYFFETEEKATAWNAAGRPSGKANTFGCKVTPEVSQVLQRKGFTFGRGVKRWYGGVDCVPMVEAALQEIFGS